eukprot:7583265-Lingulodinium_polyedra.AAC.1
MCIRDRLLTESAHVAAFSAGVIHDGIVSHRSVPSEAVRCAFSEVARKLGLPGLGLVQKTWAHDLAEAVLALAG